ncbi:hypothetical protein WS50_27325 [Burkholderia territorii]|nr:hypothetical protein WS47_27120 [Burkholderia territorii]KUZ07299.1 hypothetical protein WS50_27325 [Burkholderia territorii]
MIAIGFRRATHDCLYTFKVATCIFVVGRYLQYATQFDLRCTNIALLCGIHCLQLHVIEIVDRFERLHGINQPCRFVDVMPLKGDENCCKRLRRNTLVCPCIAYFDRKILLGSTLHITATSLVGDGTC